MNSHENQFPPSINSHKFFRGKFITKGKMMCSPYVTSQKFFLLTAFNKQHRSHTIRRGFGAEELVRWNEGSKHFICIEKEDKYEDEEKESPTKHHMPKVGYDSCGLKTTCGRKSYNLSDCIGIGKKLISQSTNNRKKASRDVMRQTLTKTVVRENKTELKPKSISVVNPIKNELNHIEIANSAKSMNENAKKKKIHPEKRFQAEKAQSFKERIENNYAEFASLQKPKVCSDDQSILSKRRSYSTTDSSGKVKLYYENMSSRLNEISIKPKK